MVPFEWKMTTTPNDLSIVNQDSLRSHVFRLRNSELSFLISVVIWSLVIKVIKDFQFSLGGGKYFI